MNVLLWLPCDVSHEHVQLWLLKAVNTSETADTAEAEKKSNATTTKPAVVTKKELRSRKKTFRVPLVVAGPGFALPPMGSDQLKVCSELSSLCHKTLQAYSSSPCGLRAASMHPAQDSMHTPYITRFRGCTTLNSRQIGRSRISSSKAGFGRSGHKLIRM